MLKRSHAETTTACPGGCEAYLKTNQKYATEACRQRLARAGIAEPEATPAGVLYCQQCGGWKLGIPRPYICDTCADTGFEPLLKAAPREDGNPRLYYGDMNLLTLEKDGTVEVYVGDDEIKPVLRAFTEALGGVYENHAVVLVAQIPVEAVEANMKEEA
jgi:hypothetical protein